MHKITFNILFKFVFIMRNFVIYLYHERFFVNDKIKYFFHLIVYKRIVKIT